MQQSLLIIKWQWMIQVSETKLKLTVKISRMNHLSTPTVSNKPSQQLENYWTLHLLWLVDLWNKVFQKLANILTQNFNLEKEVKSNLKQNKNGKVWKKVPTTFFKCLSKRTMHTLTHWLSQLFKKANNNSNR